MKLLYSTCLRPQWLIGIFVILFLTFALVACGGGNDKDTPSGPTVVSSGSTGGSAASTAVPSGPTAVPSAPTEASLRAYLASVDKALQDRDWQTLYSLTSDEYQANCPLSDFIGVLLFAQVFLGEDFFNADNQVSDVVIEGNRATFTSTRVLNGAVLDTSEETLVYEDGRWLEENADDTSCEGEADSSFDSSGGSAPELSTVDEKQESTAESEMTSDMVSIVVTRVIVADYAALYEASDEAGKRTLDAISESVGAITIGQIELTVQNNSEERKSLYPNQATIVVGNEQVETPFFLSDDDLDGEYFPGVLKEGKVFFFLKRTPYADVTKVLYVVDSPFGETFDFEAPDFEFSIEIP